MVALQIPLSSLVIAWAVPRKSPDSRTSVALGAARRNVTRPSGSTSGERTTGPPRWAKETGAPSTSITNARRKALMTRLLCRTNPLGLGTGDWGLGTGDSGRESRIPDPGSPDPGSSPRSPRILLPHTSPQLRPLLDADARHEPAATLAVGPEDQRFAIGDVGKLGECLRDVRHVGDEDGVRAARQGRDLLTQPRALLLGRALHALAAVAEFLDRLGVRQLGEANGFPRPVRRARQRVADRNLQAAQRLAQRRRAAPSGFVELALARDVVGVRRVGWLTR